MLSLAVAVAYRHSLVDPVHSGRNGGERRRVFRDLPLAPSLQLQRCIEVGGTVDTVHTHNKEYTIIPIAYGSLDVAFSARELSYASPKLSCGKALRVSGCAASPGGFGLVGSLGRGPGLGKKGV